MCCGSKESQMLTWFLPDADYAFAKTVKEQLVSQFGYGYHPVIPEKNLFLCWVFFTE